MVLDEFEALHAEFTSPYTVDVEIPEQGAETVVVQRSVPGLLAQLERATQPGGAGPALGGGGYGPREPARLSAVNLLDELRRGLAWWAHTYTGRAGADPAESLRELSTVTYAMDRQAVTMLIADLDAWRLRARWILGWDAPPFAPHVPCPDCAGIGKLRLWPAERYVACLLCRAWWDSGSLGRLRDQLRLSRDLTHA